jgi:RAB protein geranylgeranyltransferase component A
LLFARGALVQLLVNADVAKYLEFKCVDAVYSYAAAADKETDKKADKKNDDNKSNGNNNTGNNNNNSNSGGGGGMVRVPLSKSEIFQSKSLSMVEKRQLASFVHLST